jgi:hypothetical protein
MEIRKSNSRRNYHGLRKKYQQLLKLEKKQSFNAYLEETAQSEDMKFYGLMKRLSPKLKWNVNTGYIREDSIPNQLMETEEEPSYAGLDEILEEQKQKQKLESGVRCPDQHHFSIM